MLILAFYCYFIEKDLNHIVYLAIGTSYEFSRLFDPKKKD